MKISTKGRYAMRMMLEFGLHPDQCTKISQVAKNQQISDKYLEQIVTILSRADYVKSVRGAKGGYQLTMDPKDYTVGMILRLTEGSLAPVSCLESQVNPCPRSQCCATLDVWDKLYQAICDVVDHITLADIIEDARQKGNLLCTNFPEQNS